jgi:hypothetical protein
LGVGQNQNGGRHVIMTGKINLFIPVVTTAAILFSYLENMTRQILQYFSPLD